MLVYVISLRGSQERRQHAARQLRSKSVDYQFYDAFDGTAGYDAFPAGYDRRQFRLNTGRQAAPGEIGSFASHRALWELCSYSGQAMVIMEDDAHLKLNFPEALREAEKLIGDYGFIRLQDEFRGRKSRVKPAGDFSLCYYSKAPGDAMCYAISPEVASCFVEATHTLTAPVDLFVARTWEHQQPLFGLMPYPVTQSRFAQRSTIGPRRKAKNDLSLRSSRLFESAKGLTRRAAFNFSTRAQMR